jgi:hypothetical protein
VPRLKPSSLERSASADLYKNTLSRIPTLFGRIAYFGSLRNPNSGIYDHYGLKSVFGREESRRALLEVHEQVFSEWLNLALPQKAEDLLRYLRELEDSPVEVLTNWSKTESFRAYIPAPARKAEKELFLSEMDLLMEIATCEFKEKSGA